MPTNRKQICHLRNGQGIKKPTADQLGDGEIAVNYTKGGEVLYVKNTNNEVVPIGHDVHVGTTAPNANLGAEIFIDESIEQAIEVYTRDQVDSFVSDLEDRADAMNLNSETKEFDGSTDVLRYYIRPNLNGIAEPYTLRAYYHKVLGIFIFKVVKEGSTEDVWVFDISLKEEDRHNNPTTGKPYDGCHYYNTSDQRLYMMLGGEFVSTTKAVDEKLGLTSTTAQRAYDGLSNKLDTSTFNNFQTTYSSDQLMLGNTNNQTKADIRRMLADKGLLGVALYEAGDVVNGTAINLTTSCPTEHRGVYVKESNTSIKRGTYAGWASANNLPSGTLLSLMHDNTLAIWDGTQIVEATDALLEQYHYDAALHIRNTYTKSETNELITSELGDAELTERLRRYVAATYRASIVEIYLDYSIDKVLTQLGEITSTIEHGTAYTGELNGRRLRFLNDLFEYFEANQITRRWETDTSSLYLTDEYPTMMRLIFSCIDSDHIAVRFVGKNKVFLGVTFGSETITLTNDEAIHLLHHNGGFIGNEPAFPVAWDMPALLNDKINRNKAYGQLDDRLRGLVGAWLSSPDCAVCFNTEGLSDFNTPRGLFSDSLVEGSDAAVPQYGTCKVMTSNRTLLVADTSNGKWRAATAVEALPLTSSNTNTPTAMLIVFSFIDSTHTQVTFIGACNTAFGGSPLSNSVTFALTNEKIASLFSKYADDALKTGHYPLLPSLNDKINKVKMNITQSMSDIELTRKLTELVGAWLSSPRCCVFFSNAASGITSLNTPRAVFSASAVAGDAASVFPYGEYINCTSSRTLVADKTTGLWRSAVDESIAVSVANVGYPTQMTMILSQISDGYTQIVFLSSYYQSPMGAVLTNSDTITLSESNFNSLFSNYASDAIKVGFHPNIPYLNDKANDLESRLAAVEAWIAAQ